DKMESIYNNLLTKKENICLIGMPSCGKSTVGKMISARLDRTFYDSDTLIEEKVGMAVAQYIQQKGIESFRQIESEVIADLSKKNGCVISTGGGSILKEENVKCLRQNSRIFFLDRSLQNLTPTADRPLSSDLSALKALFTDRYPLYQKVCDVRIDADVSYDEIVESILNTIR
ncbi:MAG: shikimate kinase, partial [Bacteroidales bacterium]|nr:shikimate kinase [Bacteroidales bacterium]